MNMKVVFINPKGAVNEDDYELPSNIAYLAAAVEKAVCVERVSVIDLDFASYTVSETNRAEFCKRFLSPYKDDSSVVFALPVYTYCAEESKTICSVIKSFLGQSTIIIGGPHVTLHGMQIMKDTAAVDFAIAGEADFSFPELLTRLSKGSPVQDIAGLFYRAGGEVHAAQRQERLTAMETLPRQTDGFKYLDLEGIKRKIGYCSYISSRGCVFSCIFCSSADLWDHKLNYIPAAVVNEELGEIKRMGFDVVTFRDDFFTMNKKWLREVLPRLKELGLTWGCETRIDAVDEQLLREMKASGCKNLRFGIETFNRHGLEILNKKFDPVLAEKNLKAALDIGIEEVRASFIIGIPGETKEDIKKTVETCRRLKGMRPRFRALNPYPRTRLYENLAGYGLRFVENPHPLGYSTIETKHLTNTEINEILHDIYREFKNPRESYYHNDFSTIIKGRIWKTLPAGTEQPAG